MDAFFGVCHVLSTALSVYYLSHLIKVLDDLDVEHAGSCTRYDRIMNRVIVVTLIILVGRGIWA